MTMILIQIKTIDLFKCANWLYNYIDNSHNTKDNEISASFGVFSKSVLKEIPYLRLKNYNYSFFTSIHMVYIYYIYIYKSHFSGDLDS